MNFTSLLFLPFLFGVIFMYFTVFRKHQWVLLLLASVAFYVCSGPKYIVFVIASVIFTYLIARRLGYLHDAEKSAVSAEGIEKEQKKIIKKKYASARKRWLLLDLLINLGLLSVIKYTDFAFSGVSKILAQFGVDWHKEMNFVLPLGISFYTFMVVGYVLDVYWKRYAPEKNIFKLGLFAVYFPHIIQGPIGRYNKLSEQFSQNHSFDYDRVTKGAQLILWGYFEKMVIADRLAVFTGQVFDKWQQLTGFPLLLGLSLFSIQMYLDWLGCMDIARGVSQIFGIELEKNFWHPFFSKNMPEFWRRWHITLGAWFKDYLLYPVSMSGLCKAINKFTRKKWGNQASRAFSAVVPAACVWIVTGVWHGAAACYVMWGIYHGILIILSALFEIPIQNMCKKLHINTECFSFNLFRMIRTFMLSTIGRIFFVSAVGFSEFVMMLKRMFDFKHFGMHTLWDDSLYSFGLDRHDFNLAMVLVALVWVVSMLQEHFDKDGLTIRDVIAKQNLIFRWLLYLGVIVGILVFGMYGTGYDAGAFFYGRF
ncbi:MAG: MBOAT family protein [Lachnospiraceae bacterium]|nr:MBOAT family protein [Lachnospiraceae bacterium]